MQFDEKNLKSWAKAQIEDGYTRESLVWALVLTHGYALPVAQRIVEACLDYDGNSGVMFQQSPTQGVAAPAPRFTDIGRHAFDGREVTLALHHLHPQVMLFENFASVEECEALMAHSLPRLERSAVGTEDPAMRIDDARTSYGYSIPVGESAVDLRIRDRLASLTRWPVSTVEPTLVTRYLAGEKFDPHQDFYECFGEAGSNWNQVETAGNRIATALLYLNTPTRGGSTYFANVGLHVAPKQGSLLFFSYPERDSSASSLHGGMPVIEGEKWIGTYLLRQRAYELSDSERA